MFHYQIFGISIASELSLPGIPESDFAPPELTIRYGSVPTILDNYLDRGVFYYAAPGRFLFTMDSVGRYLVSGGIEIIVETEKPTNYSDVILFLLGSVMGATILQRGLLPIHGTSVYNANKTLTICGKSGAGKSSLAAAFIQNGFSLVSDDISVIDIQEERVLVKRGLQNLKLWADAIQDLGLKKPGLTRVRPSLEKYYIPYTDNRVSNNTELNTLIVLEVKNSEGFDIKKLNGIEKFEFFRSNIYRGIYIEPLGMNERIFKTISNILDHVDIYRVARPIAPLKIRELATFISANTDL